MGVCQGKNRKILIFIFICRILWFTGCYCLYIVVFVIKHQAKVTLALWCFLVK
jgi:hypothetical protein